MCKAVGAVSAGWWGGEGRPGVTRKPYASHKPCNVARAPVSINLNLYFHPTLSPA